MKLEATLCNTPSDMFAHNMLNKAGLNKACSLTLLTLRLPVITIQHDLAFNVGSIPGQTYHAMLPTDAKIPKAIKMLGRNCGIYTEDDLLLDPDANGGAVVGDSCSPVPPTYGVPLTRSVLLPVLIALYCGGICKRGLHTLSF